MLKRHRKKDIATESYHVYDYGDLKLHYKLIRCDRKSYEVQIKPGGEVAIRAPFSLPDSVITEFLIQREDWIKSKYYEQCKVRDRKETDETSLKLEKRYRTAAMEYIPKRVAFYADVMGVSYGRITIRDAKTRWGSCSSIGNLSFSWRLMLAPFSVLDYVVIHELCHRIQMNHSKDFWRLVEQYCPDYKMKRKWLKENGKHLHVIPVEEEQE